MAKFKVSVIVPVYNVEKYLNQCLNSLVNQTLEGIEIICVNDGSEDSSAEILTAFAEKYPQIKVLTQENRGLSAARNLGISHAGGEYIGFVDSDDWVDLNYFEKLYKAAEEHKCDIACAGYKRCGKVFKSIHKSFEETKVCAEINDKVKADNLPIDNYVWNKIYKRESWQVEFPEGKHFEDMAVTIKILYSMGKMVTVPDTFYNYRRNPSSIVAQKSAKNKIDFSWAKNELYSFASEHNIKLAARKDCLKKEVIKFLGLTVFKIYYYEDIIKLRLLGFIPFASKTIG